MGEVKDLASQSVESLGLPPQVALMLKGIQGEIAEAYRESFLAMVETLRKQASALERIQNTLNVLVEALGPQLEGRIQLPLAVQPVGENEEPDLATAVVVADPISAGYTLTQADLATALGIDAPDVSRLVRAFDLPSLEGCAVTVRRGAKGRAIVNYHPKAVQKFVEFVATPPKSLTRDQIKLVNRVRTKLLMAQSEKKPATTSTGGSSAR